MREQLQLWVNGIDHRLAVDPRTSLLDLVRDHLGLTGAKPGCEHGACGTCTVLVDGERIASCLALALQYAGRRVTAVEGLGTAEEPHPLQRAIVGHDGLQCGYCTPGQICSAVAMLAEHAAGTPSAVTADLGAVDIVLTDAEIRERMAGNLCRCGAYQGIVDAIREVVGGPVTHRPARPSR